MFEPQQGVLMQETMNPQTENGQGFEPIEVHQFTVFLENRVGQLQHLTSTLEQAGAHIVSVMVQNAVDTAMIRLIGSDWALLEKTLKTSGYHFSSQMLLLVELDRTQSNPIASLTSILLSMEINIHYAYPLLTRPNGPAMALYVEDPILASQTLMRKGYAMIGESDLKKWDKMK
jgi:hypothetical protein